MARDMAKKSATDYRWEKDNCDRINLKIRKDSGLVSAIDTARGDCGDSRNSYILKVLREALIRDGYLPEKQESET